MVFFKYKSSLKINVFSTAFTFPVGQQGILPLRGFLLIVLYILVQHHSGVDGSDVWGCKVMPRVFICDNNFIDIVHRVD